jgi:hypothetical protein
VLVSGVPISGLRLGKEVLKMARARITLKEGRSFSTPIRTFQLERPVISGNEAEINELRGNNRFEVVDLDSPGPAKQKAIVPPPPPPAKKPEVEEKPSKTSGPITTASLPKTPSETKPAKRSKPGKKKSTKKG